MLQVHTCVSVHCHQCADSLGGPEFEAHYPSEAAALDAAAGQGWRVGPGGRLWCSACGPVLTCEAQGHQFTEWHHLIVCASEAPVVGDEAGGGSCGEYRCRRCCLHESRPAALVDAELAGTDAAVDFDAALAAVYARAGLTRPEATAPRSAGEVA